jgi:hypothetical protein
VPVASHTWNVLGGQPLTADEQDRRERRHRGGHEHEPVGVDLRLVRQDEAQPRDDRGGPEQRMS